MLPCADRYLPGEDGHLLFRPADPRFARLTLLDVVAGGFLHGDASAPCARCAGRRPSPRHWSRPPCLPLFLARCFSHPLVAPPPASSTPPGPLRAAAAPPPLLSRRACHRVALCEWVRDDVVNGPRIDVTGVFSQSSACRFLFDHQEVRSGGAGGRFLSSPRSMVVAACWAPAFLLLMGVSCAAVRFGLLCCSRRRRSRPPPACRRLHRERRSWARWLGGRWRSSGWCSTPPRAATKSPGAEESSAAGGAEAPPLQQDPPPRQRAGGDPIVFWQEQTGGSQPAALPSALPIPCPRIAGESSALRDPRRPSMRSVRCPPVSAAATNNAAADMSASGAAPRRSGDDSGTPLPAPPRRLAPRPHV